MDNNKEIQTGVNTQPEGNGGRTFTQDEVNRIVSERLTKEKSKNEAELAKRENELQQREMSIRAMEMLTERGLPKGLADVLRYSDEESLTKALDTIQSLQGFENEEHTSSKRHIIENRLPVVDSSISSEEETIRGAFGLG